MECVRASLNWNAVAPLSHRAAATPPFEPAERWQPEAHALSSAEVAPSDGDAKQQAMPRTSAVAGCLAHIIHRPREQGNNKTTFGERGVRRGLWTFWRRSFCCLREPAVSVCCSALVKKEKKKEVARSLLTCRRRDQYAGRLVRGRDD